jgi:hypothetical protein
MLLSKFNGLKAATVGALTAASLVVSNAALATGGGGGFSLASAQSDVLGYVATTVAFITAIGIAVLGLVMIAKAVKWARKAG